MDDQTAVVTGAPAAEKGPAQSIEKIIAEEIKVTPRQIWAAIKLLDSGATVPFIARYRKEATGGLTDTHLRMLAERLEYLRELEERRISILQSIEDQKKMTPELRKAIEGAKTKVELEDLYLPFRTKTQTKAQNAREAGLEPLALALLAEPARAPETEALAFINPLKGIAGIQEALAGAKEILMEKFSQEPVLLKKLRADFWESGWILSKDTGLEEAKNSKFADYFNFREELKKIPSHRLLAVLRGRKEKALEVNLTTEAYADYSGRPSGEDALFISAVALHFGIKNEGRPADLWLGEAVRSAWRIRMRHKIEFDIMSELTKKAEEEAIKVFAENLKNLLMAAPAGARAVLGLDPGFRTGIKAAAVDRTGKIVKTVTIYPFEPQNKREVSVEVLKLMIERYGIELIAIGNGTASRETDQLVEEVLKKVRKSGLVRVIVSEAGASVYSASEYASKELPELDVSMRGAVSIARRLQDPLAELVKIEPKSIGVGQYQHDVSQYRLEKMLRNVVEDCVNSVGVDLNTASPALLSYISGLNKRSAESIVRFRQENGSFRSRQDLLRVPELGPRTFEQAAGFLRIQGGDNPLDGSAVHPEAYPLVENILRKTDRDIRTVIGNTAFLEGLNPGDFADGAFGLPTVRDILKELDKPGRDPRPEFRTARLLDHVREVGDLKPGMKLEGTVTNVANFGAFVDIGVHQDGLVHVSELADEFVENPHEYVKVGDIVEVRVVEVDARRHRVSLSMRRGTRRPGANSSAKKSA